MISLARQSVGSISIRKLDPRRQPDYSHHVGGNPPASFKNPWLSFEGGSHGLLSVLKTRFSSTRNFVPVPANEDGTRSEELVPIRKPDWGAGKPGLKATWIGHASFFVETSASSGEPRGVRTFFDPVFSDRMSPVSFFGPKRFSPPPCSLDEVPEVDLVVISHNHYDHMDSDTITRIHARGQGRVRFLCALGVKQAYLGIGIPEEEIVELDWWDGVNVTVNGVGEVNLTCTPSQHFSGRGIRDHGQALWCSWVLEELGSRAIDRQTDESAAATFESVPKTGKKMFFAGDTGYRSITSDPSITDEDSLPHCPAFKEIGDLYGPFDLALLPIGCYLPRTFMSPVHCAPEDSVCIHKDIRSKKSIGMHYGTVRGGLSAEYEDVREPPARWKRSCEKEGLKWGEEAGLCDLGETVVV